MNWKNYFNPIILSRGLDYYCNNKVFGLRKTSDTSYMARVDGTYIYTVHVTAENRGSLKLSCNCAYEGNCKHEAAVLQKIASIDPAFLDAPSPLREVKEFKTVNPFTKASDGYFFSLEPLMEKFKLTEEVYLKAKEAVESGKARCTSIGWYGDDPSIEIESSFKTINDEVATRLTLSRKKVQAYICSPLGSDCFFTDFLCVHKAACAILLDNYIREKDPGDYTDFKGSEVLNLIRKGSISAPKRLQLPDTKTPLAVLKHPVDIQPCLSHYGYGAETCLRFKIGQDRLYFVKDPWSLLCAIKARSRLSLGRNLTLDFSKETFTEKAQKCLAFFESSKQLIMKRNDLILNSELMDIFYESFEGTVIEEGDFGKVRLEDGELKFDSKVSSYKIENGQEAGIKVTLNVGKLVFTQNYCYSLNWSERRIVRITQEKQGPLSKFIRSQALSVLSFIIGTKEMRDFSYRVLPILEHYGKVDLSNAPDFSELEKPQAEFVFDLDYESKIVRCRATAVYKDLSHSLCDYSTVSESLCDVEAESAVCIQLNEIFGRGEAGQWSTYEADRIYLLLTQGLPILRDLGTVNATNAFLALKVKSKTQIKTNISLKGSLLDLSIQTEDMSLEELSELLDSYKRRKVYHRLRNGDFVELNDESIEDLELFMENLRLGRKDLIKGKLELPLYRSIYLNKLMEDRDSLNVEKSREFRDLIMEFGRFKEQKTEVPKEMGTELRSYQIDGFKWLCTLGTYSFGGILADEMGLGKTLQMLAYILHLKTSKKTKLPALIVCPASLVYNWQSEAAKFTSQLTSIVISGNQLERKQLIESIGNTDLVITSYDLLKRDLMHYENLKFSVQVIDEAQFIKNASTESSKAVKLINSEQRFALTGTPIENRLSELWSIFDFLMPGFLYSHESFRTDFEIPIMKNSDEETMTRLKRMTGPFILRRLKTDVLKDLPEKLEETRTAHLENEQRKLYDAQVTMMRQSLVVATKSEFSKSKIQILAELTRLRQICCDPSIVYENYTGGSGKRELCMDLIESAIDAGHKMLVFSQFTSVLALLEKDLSERKINYFKITGSTEKEERLRLVEKFNKGTVPVFLISLKAGGTGLNLTGADVVIHYDPWWNTAVQNQATDRAHRIGQTKPVTVYKLIAENTIEEKIMELQKTKTELVESILSGETGNLANLSQEELLAILG